jgi:hypothetical protein
MNPLAKVEAIKARLSAAGEYVPTEREVEAHFRKMGCSRIVARNMAAKLFGGDSDASGMLGGQQRDAGEVADDEQKDAVQALNRLLDVIGAQALRR